MAEVSPAGTCGKYQSELKGEFQVFVQLNVGPFATDNNRPSTIKL